MPYMRPCLYHSACITADNEWDHFPRVHAGWEAGVGREKHSNACVTQQVEARSSLLSDIRKSVQVVCEETSSWHAGAHPAEALLLLGVNPEDVSPLPWCVILCAHEAIRSSSALKY